MDRLLDGSRWVLCRRDRAVVEGTDPFFRRDSMIILGKDANSASPAEQRTLGNRSDAGSHR